MTIKELMSKTDILNDKICESALMNEIKEHKNSHKFKYSGIYILTNENDKIVYFGSAYARNLRDRLMQYQQKEILGIIRCT